MGRGQGGLVPPPYFKTTADFKGFFWLGVSLHDPGCNPVTTNRHLKSIGMPDRIRALFDDNIISFVARRNLLILAFL